MVETTSSTTTPDQTPLEPDAERQLSDRERITTVVDSPKYGVVIERHDPNNPDQRAEQRSRAQRVDELFSGDRGSQDNSDFRVDIYASPDAMPATRQLQRSGEVKSSIPEKLFSDKKICAAVEEAAARIGRGESTKKLLDEAYGAGLKQPPDVTGLRALKILGIQMLQRGSVDGKRTAWAKMSPNAKEALRYAEVLYGTASLKLLSLKMADETLLPEIVRFHRGRVKELLKVADYPDFFTAELTAFDQAAEKYLKSKLPALAATESVLDSSEAKPVISGETVTNADSPAAIDAQQPPTEAAPVSQEPSQAEAVKPGETFGMAHLESLMEDNSNKTVLEERQRLIAEQWRMPLAVDAEHLSDKVGFWLSPRGQAKNSQKHDFFKKTMFPGGFDGTAREFCEQVAAELSGKSITPERFIAQAKTNPAAYLLFTKLQRALNLSDEPWSKLLEPAKVTTRVWEMIDAQIDMQGRDQLTSSEDTQAMADRLQRWSESDDWPEFFYGRIQNALTDLTRRRQELLTQEQTTTAASAEVVDVPIIDVAAAKPRGKQYDYWQSKSGSAEFVSQIAQLQRNIDIAPDGELKQATASLYGNAHIEGIENQFDTWLKRSLAPDLATQLTAAGLDGAKAYRYLSNFSQDLMHDRLTSQGGPLDVIDKATYGFKARQTMMGTWKALVAPVYSKYQQEFGQRRFQLAEALSQLGTKGANPELQQLGDRIQLLAVKEAKKSRGMKTWRWPTAISRYLPNRRRVFRSKTSRQRPTNT